MSLRGTFNLSMGDFQLDLQFDVPSRDITAVYGRSGCGKTTLLRVIAGLQPCPGGRLELDDDVWQDQGIFRPPHTRRLGFVFQEANLFPHLSVRSNLLYGQKRVKTDERGADFDHIAAKLGLTTLLDRGVDGLSGGERQRVAIGRALLTSPRLLLMDEPLASLDQQAKAEIFPILEHLHDDFEVPVLYVSHARDEVARIADHLLLMDDGRLTAQGPVSEMLTRLDLPLARGDAAESLVQASVTGTDPQFNLSYLEFPGGVFTLPRADLALGQTVRLRVLARDVSLTLKRQADTSILNIFPARVIELQAEDDAQLVVKLDAGGQIFLARVTRKSAASLGLAAGLQVHMQVKTVALLS
jgi:molybdate transport system ATP-binding protein